MENNQMNVIVKQGLEKISKRSKNFTSHAHAHCKPNEDSLAAFCD
jgi:hypothetical protein